MIRLEIICNQSTKDDIIDALSQALPGFRYTLFPMIHGKGGDDSKLGTATWPETNVVVLCWIPEDQAAGARDALRGVKARFSHEGIVWYLQKAQLWE